MATYPIYPATTFTQAVELTIFSSNQLHDVINGDALTTVETENGDVPTLRKALVDNFYFKTPVEWVAGESSTIFNQLYYYNGTASASGWYYAPQATADNPVAMGSTPVDDDNWRLYQPATQSIPAQVYPWYTEITSTITSVSPPYEFDTAIVTLNGIVLTYTKDYTISENKIIFTSPIVPESNAEFPDVLFCYIGKVEQGNSSTNYVTYTSLAALSAAGLIGTESGLRIQDYLNVGRIVFPELYSVSLSNPTDDDLFAAMFADLEGKDDTLLGTSIPYTVDLRGKVYTLTQTHSVDININIINGTLLMNGGQIVIANELAGSRTRRVLLKDLKVRYVGTTYYPDALIKVARCYNSFVLYCDFWAGDTTAVDGNGKPLRARYGLWLGSKRAWGCGVIGGEFFGGEIPCRIGYTNDHTGITVTGGGTYHHGWVGNLLMCNPAGASISGVNIEHSENGAWGLCITSGTNAELGVINPAHGVKIEGVYFYNNGNGTTGTTNTPAGVIIGYDAPGTMDFDIAGSLITSQNTAHSITVENCYIVSPKQDRAIKLRGLAGLRVINNKYTYATGSYGITFEGTCARSHCEDNRNQSSGLFDEVEYTSTSKPFVGSREGTFLPQLVGSTVAGSLTYSTRGGDYSIANGRCHLSLWLTVSAVNTAPSGTLTIALPVAITAGRRSATSFNHVNLVGNQSFSITTTDTVSTTVSVTGALDSDATATLTASGTGSGTGTGTGTLTIPNSKFAGTAEILGGTTLTLRLGGVNMDGAVIGASTAIDLSISYPVDGAIYTGT